MSIRNLKEVADISMGQAPDGSSYNFGTNGYPLIAGAGDFGSDTPSPKKFTTSPTRISKKGDIILCIRATIGDLNWSDRDYCLGRGVAGIRPHPTEVDSKYLWFALQSQKAALESQGTGSTFKQVSRSDVESLKIFVPPLPEQRRIATILDKADAIRRKRRQAIDLMNDFLRSVFLEMFGDPLFNTKGWVTKQIGEIGKVVTGNTPSRARPEFYGDLVEWIKSDNINTPEHYLTKATEFLSEEGRAVGRTVPSGSVLVTCIAGSADCIGNAAIADREVAFNQQINAVIPSTECTCEYLYSLLFVSKQLIQSASTNSMKGMVSKSKFENIAIPVPPIDLQRIFSKRFEAINRSLGNLSASERDIARLNCSISAELLDGASA